MTELCLTGLRHWVTVGPPQKTVINQGTATWEEVRLWEEQIYRYLNRFILVRKKMRSHAPYPTLVRSRMVGRQKWKVQLSASPRHVDVDSTIFWWVE